MHPGHTGLKINTSESQCVELSSKIACQSSCAMYLALRCSAALSRRVVNTFAYGCNSAALQRYSKLACTAVLKVALRVVLTCLLALVCKLLGLVQSLRPRLLFSLTISVDLMKPGLKHLLTDLYSEQRIKQCCDRTTPRNDFVNIVARARQPGPTLPVQSRACTAMKSLLGLKAKAQTAVNQFCICYGLF